MPSTMLSDAKAKWEAAQSEADWASAERTAREALVAAGEALVAARRAGSFEARLAALELVVEANKYLGDTFAANLAVTDELAMIKRTGNKAAEAKAMQLVADVHVWRGDAAGAAECLQSMIPLLVELGDRPAQAKSLGELAMAKLGIGKKSEALAPAQEALKLFEELGDEAGKEAARRTVNVVYAERGQLDKAPNRPDALKALKELAAAADASDAAAWTRAMDELTRTGAYTQKDIDDSISAALDKDRPSASAFFEDLGILVKGISDAQLHVKEVVKTLNYIGFRLGGLGYGPRFRCLNAYKKQVGTDTKTMGALALLQVSDEAEDWETQLQYHPGILDGLLQSGSAYGA